GIRNAQRGSLGGARRAAADPRPARDRLRLAEILNRDTHVPHDVLVAVLPGRPHVATPAVARHAGLHLSAAAGRIAGVAHATIVAIEAPDIEPPQITERTAHIDVLAYHPVRAACGLEGALQLAPAALADEVDDAAGRAARKDGCRAAAHGLHPRDGLVETKH